ncbi:MAG: response regulator [Proteobacteria bacterium]|nr:response regulator [Pseudomonadota bacterium]
MDDKAKTLQVAIIEDEDAHYFLIERAIKNKIPFSSIHSFKSAGEFLEKFIETSFDIIVTDYQLPDMTGIELLEILNNEGNKIPVIMVTGQGNEMVAVRAMKLGVWDYLVKSNDFFTLLPLVIEKISRERNLEISLRKSEERFRIVFENSPIGIGLYDSGGYPIETNKALMNIFGICDSENLKKSNLFDDANIPDSIKSKLFNSESVQAELSYNLELIKSTGLYDTNKSGNIDIDILIKKIGTIDDLHSSGYLVLVQDNTERKKANENIHRLSQQLLAAQEMERQMISRDLHDKIAQDLSMLKIGNETLLDDNGRPAVDIKKRILEQTNILQSIITAVRDMSYDLRPPGLDQFGIGSTIYQYCKDFSKKTQLAIDYSDAGIDNIYLEPDIEINLYRLVQEGLNNIRKHANAGHAVIKLVASYPNIILRIEDNGMGFDVKKRLAGLTKEKRMGLRSMEERVSLLDGKMNVTSHPGKGTKILIEIPLKEKKYGLKENSTDS